MSQHNYNYIKLKCFKVKMVANSSSRMGAMSLWTGPDPAGHTLAPPASLLAIFPTQGEDKIHICKAQEQKDT